jgi:hypothetical protein
MKDLSLLTWLTQLELSVAFPLGGFIMLAVWLHRRCGLGTWVLWVGIGLGLYCAVDGFRVSLKNLARFSKKKDREPPAVSFNEHD